MERLYASEKLLSIWYVGKILGRDEEQVKVNVHFFKPPREELTIRGFKST